MWIKLTHYNYASEPQTVAEISGEAFTAEAKTFAAGKPSLAAMTTISAYTSSRVSFD